MCTIFGPQCIPNSMKETLLSVKITSNCSAIKIHFSDCFRPPIDSDQGVSGGSQTDPSHAPTLEIFIENMIFEVKIPREDFDPAVACVHYVEVVTSIKDEGAGLDKSSLTHSLGAETEHRGIVFCDIKVERTVLDWSVKDADLETMSSH